MKSECSAVTRQVMNDKSDEELSEGTEYTVAGTGSKHIRS